MGLAPWRVVGSRKISSTSSKYLETSKVDQFWWWLRSNWFNIRQFSHSTRSGKK